ncbi:MAG: restriction endonuclease [Elusimicrobiota bacterium]|nr:restriction endonuclease [Elusimicrobiota bacterium]
MTIRNGRSLDALVKAPWWVGLSSAAIIFIAGEVVGRMSFGGLIPLERPFSMILKLLAAIPALCGLISLIAGIDKGDLSNKTASPEVIKGLSWKDFKLLVGEYYRRRGYSVFEIEGEPSDSGFDLLAQKKREKLVVQCKQWKAFKVDVKTVKEIYRVMGDAAASGAVLITSGDFTRPAADFAQGKPIELIDGPKLEKLIAEAKAAAPKPAIPARSRAVLIPTEPPPLNRRADDRKFMPPGMRAELEAKDEPRSFSDDHPVCPHCKIRLVLRSTRQGPAPGSRFWGCPNHPKCTHTETFASN